MQIVKKTTPNYRNGRAGHKPEAIVIHVMAGSLAGTDAWFATRESGVSAHYGVGKNGEVHQYVDEGDTAFHCGTVKNPCWPGLKPKKNPNAYTVGIEHEGYAGTDWPEAMYGASAALIAAICKRWGIPVDRGHVIRHSDIRADKSCPGHKVDLDRLIAMARQVRVEPSQQVDGCLAPGAPKDAAPGAVLKAG